MSSNTSKNRVLIGFSVAILLQTNEGVFKSNQGPKFEIFTPKKMDFRDISHELAQPDHVQTIAYKLLACSRLDTMACKISKIAFKTEHFFELSRLITMETLVKTLIESHLLLSWRNN